MINVDSIDIVVKPICDESNHITVLIVQFFYSNDHCFYFETKFETSSNSDWIKAEKELSFNDKRKLLEIIKKYPFVYSRYCHLLCRNFKDMFDDWWDADMFNWEEDSDFLCIYCSNNFSKWWDPNKFNWGPNSQTLASYCFDYFEVWWDPAKYDWYFSDELVKHCDKYRHLWIDEFLYRRITKEF